MVGQVIQLKARTSSFRQEVLSELWKDPAKDCVIYCQDGELAVHLAVLASICPVIRHTGQLAGDVLGLSMPGVSCQQVSAVVRVLYLGTARVGRDDQDSVQDIVTMLDMPMQLESFELNNDDIVGDDSVANYDADEEKANDPSDYFQCFQCSSNFETDEQFRNHVQTCHDRTNTIKELDNNLNNLGPPQEDAVSLYLKLKRKYSKSNLPEQANVNYQEAIKILVCGVCGIGTDNFYPLMKRHYETVHFVKEEKTYYCPTESCSKKIASTNSFHSHIHIVHREASFHCQHCTKKFKTSGSLAHHTARWHTSDRPLVCQQCGEGIASALHLEAHMRMHRSKHICTVCGKKFLSASHLEKHRVTHTSDRPFMCGTCGKTFRDPYSVKECEKKHQGIKKLKPSQLIPWRNREAKFVCDTCGYRTKGKAALDRHIKGKHNSEKNFKCKECGKDFKSKTNLDGHCSVHNKITKSEPDNIINSESTSLPLKFEKNAESLVDNQEMELSGDASHAATAYFWMPHTNL